MTIRANDIDLRDAEHFDFAAELAEIRRALQNVPTVCILFSFSSKQQYLIFAVENDVRKAVKTFCISNKINIVGFNFYAQNVLFPSLQFD